MHRAAEQLIAAELRELSVYETILYYIASGYDKLNELHLKTGYSRAKISVYMKNLGTFHIVEKETSFETGDGKTRKKVSIVSRIIMRISGSVLCIHIFPNFI